MKERFEELQNKDVAEMGRILDAVTIGVSPNAACKAIVGGTFHLSENVLESILESQKGFNIVSNYSRQSIPTYPK